jgi:pimeloyl-ACP methyl ester carboxylesterase
MNGMVNVLQNYINNGTIDPVIMVCTENNPPPFEGNMYANSVLWGDYEDYNIYDFVNWVESTYRAMPYRDYRAVMGQSMGGHGAFRYAILHKDMFRAMASHAAIVTTDEDLWLEPCRLEMIEEQSGLPPFFFDYSTDGAFTRGAFLMSGAWTPNLSTPQTYLNPQVVDYLLDEYGNFIDSTQQAWHEYDISHLLQQLTPEDSTGILYSCGSADHLLLYPPNIALKDTLEMLGLPYEFYDHDGGHNMPYGFKSRAVVFLDSLLLPPDTLPPVGVPEKITTSEDINIEIFPNPADDIINILGVSFEPVTVKIHSLLGQEAGNWPVEDARKIRIPVNNLSPGMYLVTITGEDFGVSRKVVIR